MRPLKNAQFCSSQVEDPALLRGNTRVFAIGIPLVFRGLGFESDAEIGQKGAFFKGLKMLLDWRGQKEPLDGQGH
jgi:hypothetical protein